MASRRHRRVTECAAGCGVPFQPGDKIDVVREAKIQPPYFTGGSDYTYYLMSKPPLAFFHKECTPRGV